MRLLITRPLPDQVMQAAAARFEVTARASTQPLSDAELRAALESAMQAETFTVIAAEIDREGYDGRI